MVWDLAPPGDIPLRGPRGKFSIYTYQRKNKFILREPFNHYARDCLFTEVRQLSEVNFIPVVEYPKLDDYDPHGSDGKIDHFKLQSEISDYLRKSFVVYDGFNFYKWNHRHDYIYSKLDDSDIDSVIIPYLDHFKIPTKGTLLNDITRKLRVSLSLKYHNPIELMSVKLDSDMLEISPEEQLEPYTCYETDPRAWKLRGEYPLFAFNNGLFNFTTGELLPFTPYLFVNDSQRIYCDWIEGINHEAGMRFLNGMFDDPRTLNTVLDMCAYAVYRTAYDRTVPYLWVLYGKSRTGKSRTLSIIKTLLGRNVATESAEELCSNFGRGVLIGKRASISEEVSGTNLNADWLKEYSDGSGTTEFRTINRKYRDSEQHLINCTFCFATNHQIRLGSDSGIAERLRVIPYKINQNKNRELIQTVLEDPTFYSWIAELLYNRWIEIQKRNGRIEESPEVTKASNETIRAGSSIKSFLYDTLLEKAADNTIQLPSEIRPNYEDDNPEVIADMIVEDPVLRYRPKLYDYYRDWCNKNGLLVIRKGEFNNVIESEYNLDKVKELWGFVWVHGRG